MDKFDKYFSKLTPAERAYFTACTDIFHDTPYSVDGRPSMSKQLQNTVVFNAERNVSISDFPLINQTTNWDLNLVSLPWITNAQFLRSYDTGFQVTAGPNQFVMGGITMFAASTGVPTISTLGLVANPITLTADQLIYGNLAPTAPELRTFYEVLAMGYEVYNTTPDLYLGGSLVRYRVPTQCRKENIPFIDSSGNYIPRFANVIPPLPGTESLATQYPDSVIDDAKSGTYQQHCIQDSVSDYKVTGINLITMAPTFPSTTQTNSFSSTTCFSYDANSNPVVIGDFDIVGTYFAGLSPQTSLKIRARWIVSTVPSSTTSASLVSLAKMSPPDNPKLTQLVSLVQNKLPPGVPIDMNPSGEWWAKVMKAVSVAAPLVGQEFGPAGIATAQLVSSVADAVARKAKPKAKPKNTPKK
jgi:hypothetical protein